VQNVHIRGLQGFRQLRNGLTLDKDRTSSLKSDVTIRLDRHHLVEFGSHGKVQIEAIPLSQAITRVPFLKSWNNAARSSCYRWGTSCRSGSSSNGLGGNALSSRCYCRYRHQPC